MQKNTLSNIVNLVRLALVAAMYVVMTLMIEPLSYGPLQIRVSECLVLLCFYRKDYSISMILGCFIVNLFSPYGLYDIIFGTLATAAAVLPMYYVKNVYLAALFPIVSNGVIVGLELFWLGAPLWISIGGVALGEIISVGILGCLIFKTIFERNSVMLKIIGSTRQVTADSKQ